jgi:hypothetical protein
MVIECEEISTILPGFRMSSLALDCIGLIRREEEEEENRAK